MNYETFKKELVETLMKAQNNECTVMVSHTMKDDKAEDHLNIIPLSGSESYSLRMEDIYFQAMKSGMPINALADILLDSFRDIRKLNHMDTSRIFWRLENEAHCKEFLDSIPHIPFWDMQIVFYYSIPDENSTKSVRITNGIMQTNQLDANDLYNHACRNMKEQHPATLSRIEDVLLNLYPPCVSWTTDELKAELETQLKEAPKLLVLSCQDYDYGSCALLDRDILAEASSILGGDILIAPSSYNEFVIILCSEDATPDSVRELVNAVLQEADNIPLPTAKVFRYCSDSKKLQFYTEADYEM